MESEAYLEPGFDPNTLKVAELRGILLKHDVDYPSSAKKAVLLDLFNTHVAPKASSIRSNIRGVQASSRGMIDAGFTPEKAAITRRASSRRRTRGTTEDTTEEEVGADEELELPTTRRKSTARTPRRRTVEPEARVGDQTPATVRRPRKSAARQGLETPKRVEPEKEESPETPFSSYNPFQMGSPPLVKSLESDWRKVRVVPQVLDNWVLTVG